MIKHFHHCQDCNAKTPCNGRLEDNFDGSPEIVCDDFHLPNGLVNRDFICESCQWKREDAANAEAERISD